ncbi:MAG: hypothetical protein Q8L68_01905 [Methylococcales bacterium]|nr:hypothetical protein [Methylococcales bacterium]
MKPEEQTVNPIPINPEGIQFDNPAMLIHPKQFAAHVCVTVGVVGGWIDNGYVPTVKIGKYRLINLLRLKELLQSGNGVLS